MGVTPNMGELLDEATYQPHSLQLGSKSFPERDLATQICVYMDMIGL